MNLNKKVEIELALEERMFIIKYGISYEQLQKMPIFTLKLWKQLDDINVKIEMDKKEKLRWKKK